MPQLGSPLSTPPGMPAINAAHKGKQVGGHPIFSTFAEFTAAITSGATGYSADLWTAGQRMAIATEVPGVDRLWNGTHARTVILPSGKTLVLVADTNTITSASGKPSNGTGSDGDVSYDPATGYYFTKAAGTWTPTGAVPIAGDAGSMTYTAGVLTGYTKNSVTYVLNYASGVLTTLVGGGVTVTYNYTSGLLTGTTYS